MANPVSGIESDADVECEFHVAVCVVKTAYSTFYSTFKITSFVPAVRNICYSSILSKWKWNTDAALVLEVVSKPSIRSNVKAEPGIQAQEYISLLSIESQAPTPKAKNRSGLVEVLKPLPLLRYFTMQARDLLSIAMSGQGHLTDTTHY